MNKENLLKLADYLEKRVTQEQFDMSCYRAELADLCHATDFYSTHDCGSVGCALGWSPFVKGLEPIDDDYIFDRHTSLKELAFRRYSLRVFELTAVEWKWCFSADWVDIDNTPSGAARRIRCLVYQGEVPLGWRRPNGRDVEWYQDYEEAKHEQV